MKKQIINPKTELFKSQDIVGDSHFHSLNGESLNTITLGEKFSKDKFQGFLDNFNQLAVGQDMVGKQMQTFNNQLGIMQLTKQSDQASQVKKVVNELGKTRDTMIKQGEQLALVMAGRRFFNTTDLEDITLINNKGLANEDEKTLKGYMNKIAKYSFGKSINLSDVKFDQESEVNKDGGK